MEPNTKTPIPIFINLPDRIAFWETNEACLFISVWLTFLMLDEFLLGIVFGALAVKIRKRLQRTPLGDLTKIWLYWYSPFSKSLFTSIPPSYIREMLG